MRYRDDELQRDNAFLTAPDQRGTLAGLRANIGGFTDVEAIYVDRAVPRNEVWCGPCETASGFVAPGELMMHPEDADACAKLMRTPVPVSMVRISLDTNASSKEQPMAADIEKKTFTRKRVEWFVPTGTYSGGGARIEDVNLATEWARQFLVANGVIKDERGAAEGHIHIKPHDEHVVVYVEFDEEQK